MLVGDKGTLYSPNDYGADYVLLPEKDFADYKGPEPTLPRKDAGRQQRRVDEGRMGPRGRRRTARHVELRLRRPADRERSCWATWPCGWARRSTGTPTNLKAVGCPEADQYIRREYRKGSWSSAVGER